MTVQTSAWLVGVAVWLLAAGFSAPVEAAEGSELFAMTCQVCHGQAGIGGVGPALRGPKFTTPFIRKVLIEGRPGTMMPGFSATLAPRDISAIAGYVVKLQSPDGPAPAGLRGDPVAGESVFFMRGSARSCSGESYTGMRP